MYRFAGFNFTVPLQYTVNHPMAKANPFEPGLLGDLKRVTYLMAITSFCCAFRLMKRLPNMLKPTTLL